MTVNELIQTAAEDLSQVGDGETLDGETAASYEGLLNRAITMLNQDGYMSVTVKEYDVNAAGYVIFRKLEENETLPAHSIDVNPPDSVQGVARKVGIRWMKLNGAEPQTLAACNTFSLPQLYSYSLSDEVAPGGGRRVVGILKLNGAEPQTLAACNTFSLPQLYSYSLSDEEAPSGERRVIGILKLNGSAPVDLKIFVNSSLPKYRLGDTIYLSDLYHDLILYALEVKACKKYKLYSYLEQAEKDLADAKDMIDRNTLQNRPMTNIDDGCCGGYMDDFYNGLGGVGF